jgi:DNA-binding transcriptional ArsR family regulator
MSKIRGDPKQIALAHPTRAAMYQILSSKKEMATVELEKEIKVTRYHLYHHLKQLQEAGLVENHRDQGRAKFWKVTEIIEAPLLKSNNLSTNESGWAGKIPAELVELLEGGGEIVFIPIDSSAVEAINAKTAINSISKELGLNLELPFTFVPGGILVVSRGR